MNRVNRLLIATLSLITCSVLLVGCGNGSSMPFGALQTAAQGRSMATKCPCLYVINDHQNGIDSITVYPVTASGDVAPIETIAGSNTGMATARGLALDSKGDIYVANAGGGPSGYGSITAYAAGSNGNVAPTLTIDGSKTGMNYPVAVALDGSDNLYATNKDANSITVYKAGAKGDAAPIRTLFGVNTGLNAPIAVSLDSGTMYVSNEGGGPSNVGVLTLYPDSAKGNAKPKEQIGGATTTLAAPQQLAVDAKGDIYVANYLKKSVLEFAAGKFGNIAPAAKIAGKDTKLNGPSGLALDSKGNVYVSNAKANSITVYSPGANGNVTPVRVVSGPHTKLNTVAGIAIH